MQKERSLLDRIYQEPLYTEICRFVGYGTKTYRDLRKRLELLGEAYGKTRAESAQAHLLTYDGQFTATPKPLAEVKLRTDVRRYCHMLLGPDPLIPQTDIIAEIHERAARPIPEEPKAEKSKPARGKKPEKKPAAKKKVKA